MKTTKNLPHRLTERDVKILIFLWKFKVATTAMIHKRFFSKYSFRAAYVILLKLKRHSYIATRTDEYGEDPVWAVEKRGFAVIKSYLPELRANGFKSENRYHDLLCSGIHLGEFLKETPKNLILVTEQMLRNYHVDLLPSWVPNVERHMPDGYWYFLKDQKIKLLTLEVELSQKARARYDKCATFYKRFDEDSSRVLWVVASKGMAKTILNSMYENKTKRVHSFVLLKDVEKYGWSSQIIAGVHKGEVMSHAFFNEYVIDPCFERDESFMLDVLDRGLSNRTYSEKSIEKKIKTSDSMALS